MLLWYDIVLEELHSSRMGLAILIASWWAAQLTRNILPQKYAIVKGVVPLELAQALALQHNTSGSKSSADGIETHDRCMNAPEPSADKDKVRFGSFYLSGSDWSVFRGVRVRLCDV